MPEWVVLARLCQLNDSLERRLIALASKENSRNPFTKFQAKKNRCKAAVPFFPEITQLSLLLSSEAVGLGLGA
ncbi:MAG: hypothetical protein RSA68_19580, partial [Hafnia sp.]